MADTSCLLCVLVILFVPFSTGNITVRVDPKNGNDTTCTPAVDLMNSTNRPSDVPCRTINYALLGDTWRDYRTLLAPNCSDVSQNLSNVRVLLADGEHRLSGRVFLVGNMNITLEAENWGRASVQCATFPNLIQLNFDNLGFCNVTGITLKGIVFEQCGPVPSNIFIIYSEDIEINQCTFKDNTGASLQFRFSTGITIVNSNFYDNRNNVTAMNTHNETSIDDLYTTVQTSGGITIFSQAQSTSVTIDNCNFTNNQASPNPENDTRPVLLKANGHGGAILVRLSDAVDSTVVISDCWFENNYAEVDGGAVYFTYSDNSSGNVVVIKESTFVNNRVLEASGGAISLNSYNFTYNNSFSLENNTFDSNYGSAGGAFSMALYDSNLLSSELPDEIEFHHCNFVNNSAENEGTAVGLFSLVHVDQVGFPVSFFNCDFFNNTSMEDNQDTSAIAAFRFPTIFGGNSTFVQNRGGGITLLNTRMQVRNMSYLLFDSNVAVFGGGIAMDDRCLLEISPDVTMLFLNNLATESGGGIYVEFPPIRFVIDIFNRLCFLQYSDASESDIAPQDWENVNISFVNNRARLSGAAIYASDMLRCGWLGNNYTTNETLIFELPEEISDRSPFHYINNSLQIGNDTAVNRELATAPYTIHPSVDFPENYQMVQPGEQVPIALYATDQVDNLREAVWALDAPAQETVLDALSANMDTYFFTVPSLTDVSGNITLNFSLLKTLGFSKSLTLEVHACHPGYELDDQQRCTCTKQNSDILRCDDDNRYIYLREGIWGGSNRSNISDFSTARVLPGYLNCSRQGRLSGCRYQFDSPDLQCIEGRTGNMCGQCADNFGVTLDLQSCSEENCTIGLTLFILFSCVGMAAVSFIVLFLDVPIPNELRAFFFYAQVIGLVYRPYSVVSASETRYDPIAIIVNLLGFSIPIPFCISKSLSVQYVALLGFVPPLLAFFTILGFGFGSHYIKQFGNHSALKGITTLTLFVYKYVADTSFVFLSCVDTEFGFVFQYDGSVKCLSAAFAPFFFLALLVVALFVVPFPAFVSYVCVKRPQKGDINFNAYADVLTAGLKPRHSWWGGWDLGRRLPFVMISFFVVLARPSLVLFLMSLAALAVLLVHIFSKPYENEYINIIEAAILLDLLMVTGAFLDPSSGDSLKYFGYVLVFLPYVYAMGYFAWTAFNYFRSKIKKRRSYRIQSTGGRSSIDSSVAGSETVCIRDESIEREKKDTSPIQASTGHSSSGSSQSKVEESTSASGGSASGSADHSQTASTKVPKLADKETNVELREPLLDL